ncbi:MAG: tRNA (adenosine(37)-N6)-dimethylallyltransferase MiaA [Clostridia bacterium]|nr:tRNA (adenosine(37)-N6)-dimethylallyltransferase MiaA [Clostridia bacterium]
MNNTVFILTGPTASGKSSLALRLAQRHGLEIVCMDSMQIYRGMDIGTAKPTPEEQALVPHHLVDVADPAEPFSVTQWLTLAEEALADIARRGRRALFVGGTGFYLRALRHPMAMGHTAGDPALREALQAEADSPGGRERLHARLAEADPATAARLHVNDVRRVIRALEVCQLTGKPFSAQVNPPEPDTGRRFRVAALSLPRETLYARVDARVDQMLSAGLLDEVKALLAAGIPADCQAMQAIGYKELVPILRGETSLETAAAALKQNTRHYAKRQLTWLRREEEVFWADAGDDGVEEMVERWFWGEGKRTT